MEDANSRNCCLKPLHVSHWCDWDCTVIHLAFLGLTYVLQCHQGFFSSLTELQLDVEQVVNSHDSPLNIAGLEESVDHEGDLSSSQQQEILLFM